MIYSIFYDNPFLVRKYKKQLSQKLSSIEGNYSGRCFIIGNGPSLKNIDFESLKYEYTFGSNYIFKNKDLFDALNLDFYIVQDRKAMFKIKDIIDFLNSDNTIKKIAIYNYSKHVNITDRKNIYFFYGNLLRSKFVKLFDKKKIDLLDIYPTVTITMMQIAIKLGFTELVMVGVDASISSKMQPLHFYDDNINSSISVPFKKQIKAYKKFSKLVPPNIRIINASGGGYLKIFETKELKELNVNAGNDYKL